jgi:membrane protease YdiL (CAAX protease family)
LACFVLLAPLLAWAAGEIVGIRLDLHGIWDLIWYLVAAPAIEEIVFRGFFQRSLNTLPLSALQGNAITAVVFALCHIPSAGMLFPLWILPSLALGHVWLRSGERLRYGILLHIWFNLTLSMMSGLHAHGLRG